MRKYLDLYVMDDRGSCVHHQQLKLSEARLISQIAQDHPDCTIEVTLEQTTKRSYDLMFDQGGVHW